MFALEITARAEGKSPEQLRKDGIVPAVFYGPKEASTAISVDGRKLERVWKEAGETTIITLKGIGEDKDTLIHDVQFHPVTSALLHADFYVLEKGKKITISIPLEFEGSAPAEKAGHIITKVMHEIEIEVAPQELPQHLVVDLTALKTVGDHILVSDIKLPSSATLVTDAEEIVASVTEFKEEAAEIAPAPETEILTAKPAVEGEEAAAPAKEKKD
jgi:large subunit ribosomal protein L25